MALLQKASMRFYTRLIGGVGIGSLVLIYLSGQFSEYALRADRADEARAVAAIEDIAQTRFEISLLGVSTTRYLESLHARFLDESNTLKSTIQRRIDSIAAELPSAKDEPGYVGLAADMARYEKAFIRAAENEAILGPASGPGLRHDMAVASEPVARLPAQTDDPDVVKAALAVLMETNRLSQRDIETAETDLMARIDRLHLAVQRSPGFSDTARRAALKSMAAYQTAAAGFIARLDDQLTVRRELRDVSRSASVHLADLAMRINAVRDGLKAEAQSTQRLIQRINLGFSVLVALAFLGLATVVGRRLRAQAAAIGTNEMRFRQLVETLADFAVETDADFIVRHTFAKPTYRPAIDPDSLIGRRVFKQYDDQLHFAVLDQDKINSYLEARTAFRDFEYKVVTDAGYVGWRRCSGTPYYDDRGRFAGFRILAQDITALKDTERLRGEADAAYRAIATAAFGAFYRIDAQGRILSLEGLRDQPAAVVNIQRPGRFIWEALSDLGIRYPESIDLRGKILRGEAFSDVEVQTFNADGTRRGWYVHRGVPIRDASGVNTGYVIAVTNITQQRILESQARAKAQELERIIATMPGAFFRLAGANYADAIIEYISPRVVDILGYAPDELIDKPGLDLTLPDTRDDSYFRDAASGAFALQEKRLRMRRKDGTIATVIEKPVEIATRPDGSKVIEGLLIDISDLAQRDVEIAERRRQLEAVVDNLSGWIYGFTMRQREALHTFCSGNSKAIIGYTGDELIALLKIDPQNYIHPDDLPEFRSRWNEVLASTESGTYESRYRLFAKDGRQVWVVDRGRYTPGAGGIVHIDGIVLDVTAEAEALAETELVKAAVEAASDSICVIDAEGRGVYANETFRQHIELPPGTAIKELDIRNIGRFLSADGHTVRLAMSAALTQTGRYRGELDWESPSGRRRKLDMTVTRMATGHDVLIARDVTALRAATEYRNRLNVAAARVGIARGGFLTDFKAGIRELTEVAAAALDVAQVGVWLFDSEARESYTSVDVFDRRAGRHSEGEVHRRADYPLYFAALDLMRNIIAHDAVNDPVTREFKDTYLMPQGISGLLDTPIFRGGKVLGVLCIERAGPVRPWLDEEVAFATVIADSIAFGIETEERKVAERRVVAVNNQLNRVVKALDSSQDNIIIEDENGAVAYMNARAMGNSTIARGQFTPAAGTPMQFADLFPNFAKRRTESAARIEQDLNEKGTWEDEIEITYADGRAVNMELRVGRLADGGMICVATDVTLRKRHAERELGLRAQLAEAQKMEAIGRLAGGIAHDFNNIIAAVAAYAAVISGDQCSSPQHVSYATKIRTICARAGDIVKQILLFAKAKTAAHEPVVIGDIVTEARELLTASLPASVDVRIIDNAVGAVVLGASAQLLQVLLNLGLNSGDAIKEDQGYIEITLDRITATQDDADGVDTIITRTEGDVALSRNLKGTLVPGKCYVRITVRDNGPGIPTEVLERIYEPFFTTKEKSKGSGLGVPVVYSIVTAHDGAIEIRTAPGHGTRFLIYLPASAEAAKTALPAPPASACRGRVLIVDDEADLADAVSILLSKAGFEAAPVYSPQEAISVFAEDPMAWDLVLTDQVMPKMKGVALAKKLLKLRPSLPIILYTGYSDSASEDVVKAAGIRTLLFKPVEGSLLVQHISAALRPRPS
ncbi:MAG: PAS domain S-box protein [Rhodospirillaceae bacterium]|nr:PAS domain S-box protein [Rhodospirillaceae bacterium]